MLYWVDMKKYGVAAFEHDEENYRKFNKPLFENHQEELNNQLQTFQVKLIHFAKKHNHELRQNPDFRSKFMHMCSTIGVDSLSIFDRDRHLFNVNDFYYEICVRIIEICRDTRDINGGVISIAELHKGYFKNLRVRVSDIEKSLEMLLSLDGGFETFVIRGEKYLRSVPHELTVDQANILEVCSILGYATISLLQANLNWSRIRSKSALDQMVANGLLWVDKQGGTETLFWDPSWISKLQDLKAPTLYQ